MTNYDILVLQRDLPLVKGLQGGNCEYAIAKNWRKVEQLAKAIHKQRVNVPEIYEYDRLLQKIEDAYKSKIVDGKLSSENEEAKNKEIEELQSKYTEAFEKEEKSQNDYMEFLEKKCEDCNFHKFHKEDIKDATVEQHKILLPFIFEEDK